MIPVDAIETMVFHPLPRMEGWRYYRLEYGGHAMACITEGGVWLPPDVDVGDVLRVIRGEESNGHDALQG